MKRAQAGRRPTNISLPAGLVERARALDINLSRELEAHLADVVRRREGEAWRKQNARALEEYAQYVEKNGLWNQDARGW